MGVIMSAFSIASVLGVPIGLYIANIFNWNASFIFILIIGLCFLVLSSVYLPKVPVVKTKITTKTIAHKMKVTFSNKYYVLGLMVVMLMSLGSFSVIPFIAPYTVKNVGILESDLPLIYLVGG